jgi:transketolase
MGELIRESLSTGLVYAPAGEVRRALQLVAGPVERTALFADLCRLNALYMIARAGSGHIGSSFSSLDIVSWLLLEEMSAEDLYFSSKGHDAPGLYAALIGLGRLPHSALHRLRRLGGLPGHPDVHTPGIVANTGSLGMGISKAKGMVLAHRLLGERRRVFVLTGDGELQEGQIWESLAGASAHAMHELTVIVDHNKVQSDRLVRATSDLGDLVAKFASFGWHVERVDGHDCAALQAAFVRLRDVSRPKALIADTIKGRGVSFMEHTALPDASAPYRYHSGAPDADTYARAAAELGRRIDARLDRLSATGAVTYERVELPPCKPPGSVQRLVAAYGRALLEHARSDSRIVALDADLMLDMGLLPFAQALPERFLECGIAEMDMVSQAGGLALRGLLPICHSFACFLSTRANEHIYTNASERTKVIYVAGLAGLLPGGPGHSHQSVRDISALGAIPGLELIQPSDELEVAMALAYAIERAPSSSSVANRRSPSPCRT